MTSTFIATCPKCGEGKLVIAPQLHQHLQASRIKVPAECTVIYCETCQWKGELVHISYKRL